MKTALTAILVGGLVLATGCKKVDDKKKSNPGTPPLKVKPETEQPDKTSPAPGARGKQAWRGSGIGGKVVETMSSGGYTYARLDTGSGEVWVAGPMTKLAVGEQVVTTRGTTMTNFTSNTLKRTFASIQFVSAFGRPPGSAQPAPGALGQGSPHGASPNAPHGAADKPAVEVGKVEAAAGGKTVAQVFAAKDALKGKQVVVRGKVVKFNGGIMGRNWLHIRDGSGAQGTNDLTVTTSDRVAVGDVVTVRGTVATDKDFGGGYRYGLIVENASVAKQ